MRSFIVAAAILAAVASSARAQDAELAWSWRNDALLANGEYAHAVTVDAAGNTYTAIDGGGLPGMTVKISPAGEVLWTAQAPQYGAYAIGIAPSGNVFVTGYGGGALLDAATGAVLRNCPTADGTNVAFDAAGNIYAGKEYSITKLDPSGNELWRAGGSDFPGSDYNAFAIAVDAAGNVFFGGTGNAQMVGTWAHHDYEIGKLAPDGVLEWVRRYDGPALGNDEAVDLEVDSAGNVVVFGRSDQDVGDAVAYAWTIVKYDGAGNLLWERNVDVPGLTHEWSTFAQAVEIGPDDTIYVLGWSPYGLGAVVAKYDRDGNFLWNAGGYDVPSGSTAFVVDAVGTAYVGGGYGYDARVVAILADGTRAWLADMPGASPTSYSATAIAVDEAGVSFAGGAYSGTYSSMDAIAGRFTYLDLDGDGAPGWLDCNDADPSIYPGAAEVKHDGIDQDCNGHDLTIEVLKATYSLLDASLHVEATSALQAGAALDVDGFGPMSWKASQAKWTFTAMPAANPVQVTVCGVEGCTTEPVRAN